MGLTSCFCSYTKDLNTRPALVKRWATAPGPRKNFLMTHKRIFTLQEKWLKKSEEWVKNGSENPRRNKRCFLNGAFQSGVFRRVVRIRKGRRHQNARKTGVFKHFSSLWRGYLCRMSRWEISKTPFGTLRKIIFLVFCKRAGVKQACPNKVMAHMWAAAQVCDLNSCQSRFSGVYLDFQVFQDTWRSSKENPSAYWNAALSCPFKASNYANSYLVRISFWSRSGCWPCLGFFILSRFTGMYLFL